MSNKSQENFTPLEVMCLIIAFAVVVASLCLALLYKTDRSPNEISVSFSNFNGGYDVTVINAATMDDFLDVYGIGEVKANAIISYRDALGGFTDVYQLLDLNTITSQNFEDIITHFYFGGMTESTTEISKSNSETVTNDISVIESMDNVVESSSGDSDYSEDNKTATFTSRREVNINSASADELTECLLIDIKRAEQIVAMRELLGEYRNIREVLLCDLITEDIYAQIKAYLIV